MVCPARKTSIIHQVVTRITTLAGAVVGHVVAVRSSRSAGAIQIDHEPSLASQANSGV